MSRIFVVHDTELARRIVIKVLSPDLAEGLSADRFAREIKLAALLQEPHIVPVLSAGQTAEGLPWYSMPFVEGESLRAHLAGGALPLAEAVALLRNVAQALSYAHAHGVVHRDIKPENILISSGTAVVADFGIAKAVSAAKTEAPGGTITQIGMSLGTPAYMAPEQALGDAGTDHRADIYAWGAVAYEAITGEHLFPGRTTAQQIIAAHLAETPRPIAAVAPTVPPPLAALVMRCLEKDPARRPASASELVNALSDATMYSSGAALTPPPPPRVQKRLVYAIGVASVVTASLIALIFAKRPAAPETTAAPAAAGIATVAVIPFVNVSGDTAAEYFSDGMTDELAHALAQLPSLRVAGRTSSYSFKGKNATAQEVGRVLNVAGVIAGTVRRAGDRLRITAELTNTRDGLVLWSRTVERRSADVFQVQDDVTRELVAAIAPALSGRGASNVAEVSRGTSDQEAYDLYLRGRYFWAKRGIANLTRATDYFKQALARDSAFARAHAGLAQAYVVMRSYSPVPADSMSALAMESAKRALAIDSALGDAHAAMGYALMARVQLVEAERVFQRAIAYDPANANTRFWHALNLAGLGLLDSSLAENLRAEAADPMSAVFANLRILTLNNMNRTREAITQAHRTIELDSTFALPYNALAVSYVNIGLPDSALLILNRQMAVSRAVPTTRTGFLHAYAALGRWAAVDSIAAEIRKPGASFHDQLHLALVNGDRAAALDALERGLTPGGALIYSDPSPPCGAYLGPLHGEPRYEALMARLGMRVCPLRNPYRYPRRDGSREIR